MNRIIMMPPRLLVNDQLRLTMSTKISDSSGYIHSRFDPQTSSGVALTKRSQLLS